MKPPTRLYTLVALTLAAAVVRPVVSEIRYLEVSEEWGVQFRHHHGGTGEFYMIESMGCGVAVLDYDGDGDQDLFLVDSGATPGYQGEEPRSILYRNDNGRFSDVTDLSGIVVTTYGMGATAGDVDSDGDLDLYVTGYGPNQLFRNNGDGSFTDVTHQAHVGDPSWGASAAFGDVDSDGDLDLYVTNYVDFTYDNNPPCGLPSRQLRSYCHPDVYDGVPDRFYRNRGDGTFEEATQEVGFGSSLGKGLGLAFGDVNGDGWIDLYVANDMTPNYLFSNRGDGTFEEIALLAGAAYSERGGLEAGMGVEIGDLDGDGRPDIMVTHLDMQSNAVYGNAGADMFVDRRYTSHIAEASVSNVGFGLVFGDLDQDGDLDITVANGHIVHNIELWGIGSASRSKQPNQIFANLGDGRFQEVQDSGLTEVRASRGLAAGDLDGDGDLDLVVSNTDDRAEVYENRSTGTGGWMQVDLVSASGNRFSVGSKLELVTTGKRQLREVRTASSYMSQNAMTVHFGLGGARQVEALRIRWPGGKTRVMRDLPADRRLRMFE